MKASIISAILLFSVLSNPLLGQVKFSLATDLSYLHNFDKQQRFSVFGQTLQGNWHLDKKNTFYTRVNYYAKGKYNSNLSATAKSVSTLPQSISVSNNTEMSLKIFSVGIKRYLVGYYDKLEKFNLYGSAGFGLIFGAATNNFSVPVDTSIYIVQNNIASGSGNFKRLTFDITGGWEIPVGYEIFLFTEARLHIPTSDYPSNYLLKNDHAPFTGSLNLGFRILFNNDR